MKRPLKRAPRWCTWWTAGDAAELDAVIGVGEAEVFAAELSVSVSTVQRWRRGEMVPQSRAMAEAIMQKVRVWKKVG